MSESNLKLRDDAVPFISWHQGEFLLTTNALKYFTCPLVANSNLIEAYLTLFLPVDSPVSCRVSIGEWDASGVNAIATNDLTYRTESHTKLTGNSSIIASVGGVLILDGIDLLAERAKFNDHGFVLILAFTRTLSTTEIQLLSEKLLISCSAQMGLI